MVTGGRGPVPSGVVGILHFSSWRNVLVCVFAHLPICRWVPQGKEVTLVTSRKLYSLCERLFPKGKAFRTNVASYTPA